jgi:dTDP-4-dehydrorhamnose reductase
MNRSFRSIVLGASGFVGGALMRGLQSDGTSTAGGKGLLKLEARSESGVADLLERLAPDLVINCIGLADVDRAERDPALAGELNVQVVRSIARARRQTPFRLFQISTDYVFDGSRGGYAEGDEPHPVNEYGRSKLRGEVVALSLPDALVLRISAPFGEGFGERKPQFFRYVAETLRSGRPVTALEDQRVTATFLPDLVSAVPALYEQGLQGIVHLGSEDPLSRFEFARRVARTIGADESLVRTGMRDDMKQWVAPRPGDTTLDVHKSTGLGVRYTSVDLALKAVL